MQSGWLSTELWQPASDLTALDVDAQQGHHQDYQHDVRPQFARSAVPIQQLQHGGVFLFEAIACSFCFVSDFVNQALLLVQLYINVLGLKLYSVQLINNDIKHFVNFLIVALEPSQALLFKSGQSSLIFHHLSTRVEPLKLSVSSGWL